jgi:hypothetical protein
MNHHLIGRTGTDLLSAKAAIRLLELSRKQRENTVNRRTLLARFATDLQELSGGKRTIEWLDSVPVVDLDTWAVQNAPELIAEAERTSGVLHWTTRERAADDADTYRRAMDGRPAPDSATADQTT